MSDTATAGSSLLLTQHEKAHREHLRAHQHHGNLHKRQATSSVVTEVTQTISFVQQVDVDSNGSTFAVETVPVETSTDPTPTGTSGAASSTIAASPITSSLAAAASSTGASASISSLSLATSSGASLPASTAVGPTSSVFASLSLISNSSTTSVVSSSSFSSPLRSNSTVTSSSSSNSQLSTTNLYTYLTSTSTSSFIDQSSTSDASSTTFSSAFSSTSGSPSPTSTGTDGFFGGTSTGGSAGTGTGTVSESTSTSTSAAGSGGSSNTSTPTPVVVGSVVGSIAGFAVMILVIFAILRWWKTNKGSHLSLSSTSRAPETRQIDFDPGAQPSGGYGGNASADRPPSFLPAALASLAGMKRDRSSRQTVNTVSSGADSERGFYRVSGRKLPSVLQTGGDGYGGEPFEGGPTNTLNGTSFYRDSQGFCGGAGTVEEVRHTGANPVRASNVGGVPIMRPSPARTPVTSPGPFVFPSPPTTPSNEPDRVGRSLASQDGSHPSKFTEEV
ncbi:hypothetical protein BP6252_01375 [Coleophoma cylindrospora]|uniref:Uncharacterized protein n=1 Tax=Coleophoma cylindrospora TaxID=1849047 RepID=A0A3D8SSN7_9HELO|nr:hypothetical protein BP6252_01375 [Coleophoma cylindrospora]